MYAPGAAKPRPRGQSTAVATLPRRLDTSLHTARFRDFFDSAARIPAASRLPGRRCPRPAAQTLKYDLGCRGARRPAARRPPSSARRRQVATAAPTAAAHAPPHPTTSLSAAHVASTGCIARAARKEADQNSQQRWLMRTRHQPAPPRAARRRAAAPAPPPRRGRRYGPPWRPRHRGGAWPPAHAPPAAAADRTAPLSAALSSSRRRLPRAEGPPRRGEGGRGRVPRGARRRAPRGARALRLRRCGRQMQFLPEALSLVSQSKRLIYIFSYLFLPFTRGCLSLSCCRGDTRARV